MGRPLALWDPGPVGLSCVIVDDNAEFLEAARSFLERDGIQVVGVAATASDALRQVREWWPQVVLVDIELGADSGFDVARRIAKAAPTKIILVSAHSGPDFAELISASPAAGFISKSELSAHAIQSLLTDPAGEGASATEGR
jgi:two-component system, NarL family, nitrate/nitrite response regulator NarL